jgi:predicted RNA-binding Zn-ribbon protein involved in translation (DUF1610 family)
MFFRTKLSAGWGKGVQSTYNISERLRKNYCPACGELLKIERRRKRVHSKSKEAENWDFSFGSNGRVIGIVTFHFDIFRCEKCGLEMTVEAMRSLKREQRKAAKKRKKENRD